MTLSSTEAEYVSISEVCTEIMYILQILEFLKMKVELPVQIYVDNLGAIYMANNATTSSRTKHVDIRYHYTKNLIDDDIVKIVFVKSADNKSDIYTKNTSQDLFDKHIHDYIGEIEFDKS